MNPTTNGLQIHTSVLDSICSYLYAPYSHIPSSILKTSSILLTKTMLGCPQHASQACIKTCIILLAKKKVLLLSFIIIMIAKIQRESERTQEVKPREWSKLPFSGIY